MATERLFADVLQKYYETKKTGALFISVTAESENLVRFYFRDGEIIHLNYGPIKDKECLDVIDCYDFDKAVFFSSHKSSPVAANLPKTANIIAMFRNSGKKIMMDLI